MDNPRYRLNFESWLADFGSSSLVKENTRLRFPSSLLSRLVAFCLLPLSLLVRVISSCAGRDLTNVTRTICHTGHVLNPLHEVRCQHLPRLSHDDLQDPPGQRSSSDNPHLLRDYITLVTLIQYYSTFKCSSGTGVVCSVGALRSCPHSASLSTANSLTSDNESLCTLLT